MKLKTQIIRYGADRVRVEVTFPPNPGIRHGEKTIGIMVEDISIGGCTNIPATGDLATEELEGWAEALVLAKSIADGSLTFSVGG